MAWKSVEKASHAAFQPGDKILFKRGDSWRGQLIPQSGQEGAPITYGAYGEGAKPRLIGSVSRNNPKDWNHEGENIWSTAKLAYVERETLGGLGAEPWGVHAENGAKVKSSGLDVPKGTQPTVQIDCAASGSAPNHIQLTTHGLAIKEGDRVAFTFRARCTKPFAIHNVSLMKLTSPWTSYGHGSSAEIKVGTDWSDCVACFKVTQTADDARLTLYLGGALPAESTFSFQPVSWKRVECNEAEQLMVDVGNIIFDQDQSAGVKKWKPEDLKRSGDYWYSAETRQVKLYSEKNPAEAHKSIELALNRHIINEGGKSHVVYENLALWYGAAHGIGGGGTHHIVVRDCDIAWIGGGHQFTPPNGKPVRFGNGIEFWDNAHDNLVEGCRIWEIYDAALTNQGAGKNGQIDITYRRNIIWNSEYSFEYWNRPESSVTRNVRFEFNTCVNAGFGWGHGQRPDPNGRHLMFYHNVAKTTEVSVCNNIFCNSTDSCLRMQNDWTAGLVMDHNCWFQSSGVLLWFLKEKFTADQFAAYKTLSHLDAHSVVADPKFVAADKQDFRLAPDSPARSVSTEGGPVGALK